MRETFIEDEVSKLFEKSGWLNRKAIYAGIKGSPDRWYFKRGVLCLIEFKKRDEEPNGQQKKQHGHLNDAGFYVHVIDNIADGETLLWKYELWLKENPAFKQPKIRL